MGDIFSRCIRTGTFCSYHPDPISPIAWEFAATDADSTIEPAAQPVASGVPTPARADHPQAAPAVLGVSPFLMAERTAFVGRESEGSAIRTVIDYARTGQGSIVMLWDGPGVGKTRLAMEMAGYASRTGFRCSVGHCYERDEPYPYLPFAEIIESNLAQAASLDDYRGQMGFSPIFRSRWNCRSRNSAAFSSKAFRRRWPGRLVPGRSYLFLKTFIGPTNRPWRF